MTLFSHYARSLPWSMMLAAALAELPAVTGLVARLFSGSKLEHWRLYEEPE